MSTRSRVRDRLRRGGESSGGQPPVEATPTGALLASNISEGAGGFGPQLDGASADTLAQLDASNLPDS